MQVIDSHAHVWDPRRFDYPWLAGLEPLDRPMLPADIDRADGRVTGMVFVQADCEPGSALDEARWVDGLDWAELAGIVAGADFRDRAGLPAHLDALTAIRRVVGIRHLLQDEPDDFFTSPALRDGLAALAERRLTFDACVRHEQLPLLVSLLATTPSAAGRASITSASRPSMRESTANPAGDGLRRSTSSPRSTRSASRSPDSRPRLATPGRSTGTPGRSSGTRSTPSAPSGR